MPLEQHDFLAQQFAAWMRSRRFVLPVGTAPSTAR